MRAGARRWARPWALVAGLTTMSASACGEDEPPPVTAARSFARAARAGDVERLLTLVDSQTASRVQLAAERASDQVGGRRSVEPQEMLQVVDVDPRFQVAKAELVSGNDLEAVVKLTGADESAQTLQLFFEDDAWRVRLTAPPDPMGES